MIPGWPGTSSEQANSEQFQPEQPQTPETSETSETELSLEVKVEQKQKELFEVLGVENREEAKELDLDKLDDETIKKARDISKEITELREEKEKENTKEQILEKFPGAELIDLDIGGKTSKEFIKELEEKEINISAGALDMLKSNEFTTSQSPGHIQLIRIKVSDLGFTDTATTEEIYQRAQELGLELCPAETGPNLRLKYTGQPVGEWLYVGMEQITDRRHIFHLDCDKGGLWLSDYWADPSHGWFSAHEFVFKVSPQHKSIAR